MPPDTSMPSAEVATITSLMSVTSGVTEFQLEDNPRLTVALSLNLLF